MKSFIKKKEELAKLKDKLAKSRLTVFTSFARVGEKGLNVSAMRELKEELRRNEAEYLVSKKTLFNKALKARGDAAVDVFQQAGSLGLVIGYGDEAAAAKLAYNFARKNPALKFFGALLAKKFIDAAAFAEFAKLPNREILISRFMSAMKFNVWKLANVLEQIAKQISL